MVRVVRRLVHLLGLAGSAYKLVLKIACGRLDGLDPFVGIRRPIIIYATITDMIAGMVHSIQTVAGSQV